MKDTKFIELLNLYVDQQIEPTDAALLEQEIAHNPDRRETYQEYCRLHRACVMAFEQSQAESSVGAKLAASALAADRKVIGFPGSRARGNSAWYGAGLGLVAACGVLFFFIGRADKVRTPAAPAPNSPREQIVVSPPTPPTDRAPSAPQGTVVAQNREIPESLQWLTQVNFTPLVPASPDGLRFELRPIQSVSSSTLILSTVPREQATESNALKYQLGK